MMRAIVVGAGIAGLAVAAGLRHTGWSVQVLEQLPELRTSGTAVVLHRSTVMGLESLELGPGVAALSVPLTELRLCTRRASPIIPPQRATGSILIERSALAGLLRGALPGPALTVGHPVTTADLTQVCAEADLVVGADGVHSSLRHGLFGRAYRATATGTTVWRGTSVRTTAGLTEYWGQRRRFGVSDRPGGGTNWYATAVLPPAGRTPVEPDLEELRRLFGHWADPVAETVAGIREGSVLRHDILRLSPRLPRYYAGNLALIGDAAHAMTPDLGRGANEAILDALSLAHHLDRHRAVEPALAAYDKSRRRVTQRTATGSAVLDTLIHRVPWQPRPKALIARRAAEHDQ